MSDCIASIHVDSGTDADIDNIDPEPVARGSQTQGRRLEVIPETIPSFLRRWHQFDLSMAEALLQILGEENKIRDLLLLLKGPGPEKLEA